MVINTTQSNGIYILDYEGKDNSPLMIIKRKHYKEAQHYLIRTREKTCKVVTTNLIKQTLRYSFLKFEILEDERKDFPGATNVFNIAV